MKKVSEILLDRFVKKQEPQSEYQRGAYQELGDIVSLVVKAEKENDFKVWVILYNYDGYDGEIDRLWTSDEDNQYLIFSSQQKAQAYFDSHKLNKKEFEIKATTIL